MGSVHWRDRCLTTTKLMGLRTAVAEILLADVVTASRAGAWLTDSSGWPHAILLARQWRVVPNLYERVEQIGASLPPAELTILRKELLHDYSQSAFRALVGIQAAIALEEEGISVAAFKGAASMAYLYGGPKYRTSQDVDLLIQPKDLAAALGRLDTLGFQKEWSEPLADYLQFIENGPAFAGNRAAMLYGPKGGEIDLHWQLEGSGLETETVLCRLQRVELMGASIPVADPADCFLLTMHHLIRENLSIESGIRDLLDLKRWCEHFEQADRMDLVLQCASDCGTITSTLAVLNILAGYDQGSAAAHAARRLEQRCTFSQQRSAARLTELFHYQLRQGALNKDVFHLVHLRPWRQVLRGLLTTRMSYRQTMLGMERRRGGEIPLSRRIVQIAQSLPGFRGLRLARELARIKYRRD